MKLINKERLDAVAEKAKHSDRLRMNDNFHDSLEESVQRLLNALEVGTVIPIHRHQNTAETYILLRGELHVVFYNAEKVETDRFILNPATEDYGIDVPAGQWHTLEVIRPSVLFEIKKGPYCPFQPEDLL